MIPYYADDTVTLFHGDALSVSTELEPRSVRTIVTSPPYFGLRDYGEVGQIGVEESPHDYVQRLVAVFHALRDALTDDGTLWLNLGDSYSSTQSNNGGYSDKSTLAGFSSPETKGRRANDSTQARRIDPGVAAKNLVGIPWRVAFALQDDGWILRSDVIWAKPNPMPESVTDRPTKSHEHLFLLAKSPRYYYDAPAIYETYQGDRAASRRAHSGNVNKKNSLAREYVPDDESGRNKRDVWIVPTQPFPGSHFAVYPSELIRPCIRAGSEPGDVVLDPFSGSGTTGMVATQEGRRYVGIDLSREYLDLSLSTRFLQPTLNWNENAVRPVDGLGTVG